MRAKALLLALFAFAGCDRVTSPSLRDAGADSLASLWEQVDAGSTNYNAVSGSAPDNVFIVGDHGTILHWDGSNLLPEPSGTTANLRGVAVPDPTLAFAVGEQGTILRRQDGVWIADASPTTAVLNAVAAHATSAVAVGEQGTILIYSAGAWTKATNSRTDNFYAVTDSSEGMLAVGALGIVVRVSLDTPSIASTSSIPGYTKVLAGAARYSAGALLVGLDGGFFYWANGASTRLDGFPQKFLRGISFADGAAWIVGHQGFVGKKRENESATVIPTPDDRWLTGVYAAAPTDLWIVGRSGLILRGPPGERDGGAP